MIANTDKSEIIRKYIRYVYAFAFSMLKNKSDAEDITQDVFVQYITKAPHFESDEHAKNWLLKVTANLCRNFHKSGWKRYVSFLNESHEKLCSENKNTDRKIIIDDAMKHLPAKYHSIIHLFYYEDMSVNEISSIMNMNPATVRTRLKRGREILKKLFEERGINLED